MFFVEEHEAVGIDAQRRDLRSEVLSEMRDPTAAVSQGLCSLI